MDMINVRNGIKASLDNTAYLYTNVCTQKVSWMNKIDKIYFAVGGFMVGITIAAVALIEPAAAQEIIHVKLVDGITVSEVLKN